jgi:hypothetical protein
VNTSKSLCDLCKHRLPTYVNTGYRPTNSHRGRPRCVHSHRGRPGCKPPRFPGVASSVCGEPCRLLQHHRVFTHSIRYARVDLGLRVNFEGVLPLDKKDPSILSGRRQLLSISTLLSIVRESFLVTDKLVYIETLLYLSLKIRNDLVHKEHHIYTIDA